MADWCITTGQAPATYYALTILERAEFIKAANRRTTR